MEEAGRGRWKKFTAEAGRSSPRWVEEVERGTHLFGGAVQTGNIVYKTDRVHGLHFMAWRAAYAMESDKHNGFENSIC